MTDVREQYAIPYFGDVPVPHGLSDAIRKRIDTTGDGVINRVDEAWTAYRLAKQKTGVSEQDHKILTRLSRRFTQVNVTQRAIRVYGHRFNVVISPEQVTPKPWDLNCLHCVDTETLFYLGEALRSFGKPMVTRWAHGGAGERPLTLVFAFTEDPPPGVFLELQDKMVVALGIGQDIHERAVGIYIPRSNVLVVTRTSIMEISALYTVLRHELGHAVDDWLHPADADKPVWAEWSYCAKILDEGRHPALRDGLPAFYGEYAFHKLMPDAITPAVPMTIRVEEGFASLFENAHHWREESPDLLRAVHCFLRGGTARSCWVE